MKPIEQNEQETLHKKLRECHANWLYEPTKTNFGNFYFALHSVLEIEDPEIAEIFRI